MEDHRFPLLQADQLFHFFLLEADGIADDLAVVFGEQTMGNFEISILNDIWREFVWNLISNKHALTIGAYF
ncbi:hypothetical protein D3C80_1849560 [compost metagenome]